MFALFFALLGALFLDRGSQAVDLQDLRHYQLLQLQEQIDERVSLGNNITIPGTIPSEAETGDELRMAPTLHSAGSTVGEPENTTATTVEPQSRDAPGSQTFNLQDLTDNQLLQLQEQIDERLSLANNLTNPGTIPLEAETGDELLMAPTLHSAGSTVGESENTTATTVEPQDRAASGSQAIDLPDLTENQLQQLQERIEERLGLKNNLTTTIPQTNTSESETEDAVRLVVPTLQPVSLANGEPENTTATTMEPQNRATPDNGVMLQAVKARMSNAGGLHIGMERVAAIKRILSGYEKHIPPPLPVINVTLMVHLNCLIGLDAHTEEATYLLWIHLEWNDPRLTFTPLSSPNATLNVPQEMIWRPDIMIQNIVEATYPARYNPQMYVVLRADGTVTWTYPVVATTYCDMNTRNFPSDTQKCPIIVTSWSFDNSHIVLEPPDDQMEQLYYQKDSEWELTETTVEREAIKYPVADHPFSQITIWISFKRGSLYYHAYLVFPGFMIALLSIIGLFSPTSSNGVRNEKVTFGITVMLTLAIFLLLLAKYTAKTSENFPRLGTFFIFIIALIALGTIVATLVLLIERRGLYNTPFPDYLRPLISMKRVTKDKIIVNPDLIDEFRVKASRQFRKSTFGTLLWPKERYGMESPYSQSNGASSDQGSYDDESLPNRRKTNKRDHRSAKREKLGHLLRKAVTELQNVCDFLYCRDTRCCPDEWHRLGSVIDLICFVIFTTILFIAALVLFLSLA